MFAPGTTRSVTTTTAIAVAVVAVAVGTTTATTTTVASSATTTGVTDVHITIDLSRKFRFVCGGKKLEGVTFLNFVRSRVSRPTLKLSLTFV